MLGLQERELQHVRHDVGLGNRLALDRRQRAVGVRARPQRGIEKRVPRHGRHGAEYARIANAARLELLLDHSPA